MQRSCAKTRSTEFNIDLVRSYTSFLRKAGATHAPALFQNTLLKDEISTPCLSWIYYNRNNDLTYLENLLEWDKKRSEQVVGKCIISSCRNTQIEKYFKKENIYQDAVNIINKIWPMMGSLIEAVRPIISFPDHNEHFESRSDPKVFGEIKYNMESSCSIKWAEIIVHEMTHHYLFAVMASWNSNFIFNRPFKDIRFSSLRKSPRPLIGIYHSLYAQSSMIILASRIMQNDFGSYEKEKAEKMLKNFRDTFPKDIATIRASGLIGLDAHIMEFILMAESSLGDYF